MERKQTFLTYWDIAHPHSICKLQSWYPREGAHWIICWIVSQYFYKPYGFNGSTVIEASKKSLVVGCQVVSYGDLQKVLFSITLLRPFKLQVVVSLTESVLLMIGLLLFLLLSSSPSIIVFFSKESCLLMICPEGYWPLFIIMIIKGSNYQISVWHIDIKCPLWQYVMHLLINGTPKT